MVNFLKKLFNVLKFIVPILLVGAFVYTLMFRPVKDQNNVANIISLDKVPSDTLRDDKGQLHAQKEVILVPTWSMAEALYKDKIDSLKKELGLKDEKILSMGTVAMVTETNFKPSVVKDTVTQHIVLSYKNKWTDLNLTTDTSQLSRLITRDSLVFATIKQPYGLFKMKEKVFIDVKSANPNVKHIGVNYFEVAQPKNNKSKFGFGIGVGPGISIYPEGGELKAKPSWVTIQGGIQYRF